MEEDDSEISLHDSPPPVIRRRSTGPTTVYQIELKRRLKDLLDVYTFHLKPEGLKKQTHEARKPTLPTPASSGINTDVENADFRSNTDFIKSPPSSRKSSAAQRSERSSSVISDNVIPQFRRGSAIPNSVVRASTTSSSSNDSSKQPDVTEEENILDKIFRRLLPDSEEVVEDDDKLLITIKKELERRKLLTKSTRTTQNAKIELTKNFELDPEREHRRHSRRIANEKMFDWKSRPTTGSILKSLEKPELSVKTPLITDDDLVKQQKQLSTSMTQKTSNLTDDTSDIIQKAERVASALLNKESQMESDVKLDISHETTKPVVIQEVEEKSDDKDIEYDVQGSFENPNIVAGMSSPDIPDLYRVASDIPVVTSEVNINSERVSAIDEVQSFEDTDIRDVSQLMIPAEETKKVTTPKLSWDSGLDYIKNFTAYRFNTESINMLLQKPSFLKEEGTESVNIKAKEDVELSKKPKLHRKKLKNNPETMKKTKLKDEKDKHSETTKENAENTVTDIKEQLDTITENNNIIEMVGEKIEYSEPTKETTENTVTDIEEQLDTTAENNNIEMVGEKIEQIRAMKKKIKHTKNYGKTKEPKLPLPNKGKAIKGLLEIKTMTTETKTLTSGPEEHELSKNDNTVLVNQATPTKKRRTSKSKKQSL